MKIKIFNQNHMTDDGRYKVDFEGNINNFLEENKEKIRVVDIKYAQAGRVLIMYEEEVSGKRMKSIGREVTVSDVLDRCFKLEGDIMELRKENDESIERLQNDLDSRSPGQTFVGGNLDGE